MLRALVVFASAGLPVAAGSAVAGLHSIDLQGLDVQFAPEFEHDGRVNVSIKCLASHIADRHGPLSSAIQAAPGLYPGDSLGPTVWYNSDLVAGPDGPLGAGWQLEQLPYLFEVQTDEVTGTLTNYLGVSLGQDRVPYFEESTLDAAGGLRGVSLTRDENGTPLDPDDDVYTLLITRGMEWTAYDFASPTSTGSSTVAAAGTLLEVRTGRSTVIVADRHTDGQPATLLRTHPGSTVEDQLVLVYNIDDVVESIELQTRPDSTASFATVREVVFSYLDTTTAGIGVEGDLIGLEASIGGTPHAVQQFRYTDAAGLTMVVGTEGVRQAQLSDGVTPVLQKTAAALGSWSKLSADYDGTRVGTLRLAGDGCGCGGGGSGSELELIYDTAAAHGHNLWTNSVEETRPDGARVKMWYNSYGRPLLARYEWEDATSTTLADWEYFEYGASGGEEGRLVLHATPAAIASVTVNGDGTFSVDLRDDQGLIRSYTYYGPSDPGGPEGYLEAASV